MSPRSAMKAQPQMIRSNSSGGVIMTNSINSNFSKLQRHRTTADGVMISFSSFRSTSGSPKRSFNPSLGTFEFIESNRNVGEHSRLHVSNEEFFSSFLADLEFPPPPLDLPPPPEESNGDGLQVSQSNLTSHSNDVATTEPSVEEASSRFGVSLRKREPSTDSCSSLGSPAAGPVTNEIVSESTGPTVMAKTKGKLETKLAAELKERNEHYQRKPIVDVPNPNTNNYHCSNNNNNSVAKSSDHVLQLVNELAETMNLPKSDATTNSFKAQLKKVDSNKKSHKTATEATNSVPFDFKSRLRKVENNNDSESISDAASSETRKMLDNDHSIPDARVTATAVATASKKSVSKRGTNDTESTSLNNGKKTLNEPKVIDVKKTDFKIDLSDKDSKDKKDGGGDSKGNTTTSEEEDKRRSTGSISSLKKLWEAKEGNGTMSNSELSQIQLSPKLAAKGITLSNNNKTNDEEFDTLSANKKPAVPTKPTKLVSIYATPIQVKLHPDSTTSPPSSSTTSITCSNNSTTTTNTTTTQVSREAILDLIQLLESTLKSPINSISASQWLQLSDKLNILQTSCVSFADKASMAPHSKFQFRELVSRVENQSRSLRTAGSKNTQDNEKLVFEVGQSLKQISNALHR